MRLWTGRILTTLGVLFMVFDCVIKFTGAAPVVESMNRLGYAPEKAPIVGAIAAICLILYLIPRTAVVGAILLTGYFGGAMASQFRVGEPLFSFILFPTYIAALLWGGLYARDARVRQLL